MADREADRKAILKVHSDWWLANTDVNIPLMVTCFPTGDDNYLMFNLNWHPYFGMTEKVALWEYYRAPGLKLDAPPLVRIMRFALFDDVAYIACEAEMTTTVPEDATGLIEEVQALPPPGESLREYVRATEIYQRNDGEGRPVWKLWHFHCSPLAPPDQPRPGFSDTRATRGGLGANPWAPALDAIAKNYAY